jgi:predicted kinase
MISLFGQQPEASRFSDYYARVESLIWKMAEDVLRVERDVILDSGFWSRRTRDLARDRILSFGATPKFYALSCPEAMMRARTLERSENPPLDSFWIDENAFDTLRRRFEPMQPDEEFTCVDGTV